jgi:hypothetical protein
MAMDPSDTLYEKIKTKNNLENIIDAKAKAQAKISLK